jgi:putative transposase
LDVTRSPGGHRAPLTIFPDLVRRSPCNEKDSDCGARQTENSDIKTTERGGARGFDAHKRVKGRKRHILVDTLGLLVANRVEPADTSDRRAGGLLLGGLSALFPRIRTIIADAGHESRKLARTLKQHQGWQLRIVKRRQRAFKITGLTWIVERSFAWPGRNRRLSKDYEYRVQTSETMIDLAAIRLMLNRIAPL